MVLIITVMIVLVTVTIVLFQKKRPKFPNFRPLTKLAKVQISGIDGADTVPVPFRF